MEELLTSIEVKAHLHLINQKLIEINKLLNRLHEWVENAENTTK